MNQENRREPATSETAVKRELSSSFRLLPEAPRSAQAVDGQHQQQDEAEQQQIADPEPETGQGGEGDQAQQGMGRWVSSRWKNQSPVKMTTTDR